MTDQNEPPRMPPQARGENEWPIASEMHEPPLDWLSWLDDELNHKNSNGPYHPRRRITDDEWAAVLRMVDQQGLAVEPHSSVFGFGVAVSFYDRFGLCVPPERFLTVEQGHFGERFPAAWARFLPLISNATNTERLAAFGLAPVREASHYEY